MKEHVNTFVRKVSMRPYAMDVEVGLQQKSLHRHTNVPMSKIRVRPSGSPDIDGYEPIRVRPSGSLDIDGYYPSHSRGTSKLMKRVVIISFIPVETSRILHRRVIINPSAKSSRIYNVYQVTEDDEYFTKGGNSWNIRKWCDRYREFNVGRPPSWVLTP